MNHDGLIELLRDGRLVASAKIAAPLKLGSLLLRNLDRFVVRHTRKRRHNFLQLRQIAFEDFQFLPPPLEHTLNDERNEALGQIHHVLDGRVGNLGFDHPEFCEMPPGFGFFSAERWAEAIDLAEGRGCRFAVQLPGLRQECFVIEIFHFEERCCAFASRGGEYRRVTEREAVVVQEISRGFDDLVADFENGALPRRADPQVPMVHEEFDTMFFRRDREWFVF